MLDFSEITDKEPERQLLAPRKRTGGRNALGRMTSRHRGGGHKRRYRIIDFRRNKDLVPAKVAAIEYDPNRSARLALLNYADGEKRYMLAPVGLRVGDPVVAGEGADIKPGNAMPLRLIPTGTMVHNVELKPGRGGQLARSAGAAAQLMAKEGGNALLKLPSGELRYVQLDLPRDDRPGRQPRSRERVDRQGGPHALEGQAPARARHGHEPGRPSARWRRRALEGQSPAVAVGPAGQGLQDAAQPAHRSLHREAAQQIGGAGGTFSQERAVHRSAPARARWRR